MKAAAFSPSDHETWRTIYSRHQETRDNQVYKLFADGLKLLPIHGEQIPDLREVNQRLKTLTNFEDVLISNLEKDDNFYRLLANKQFPVGNFIRDKKDLTYTPEPDIVHDLYGHLAVSQQWPGQRQRGQPD